MQERSVYSSVQCTTRWYQNIMSKTTKKNPNFQRQAMLENEELFWKPTNVTQPGSILFFISFPLFTGKLEKDWFSARKYTQENPTKMHRLVAGIVLFIVERRREMHACTESKRISIQHRFILTEELICISELSGRSVPAGGRIESRQIMRARDDRLRCEPGDIGCIY